MLSEKAKQYNSVSGKAFMFGFFLNLSRFFIKNKIIGIASSILYIVGALCWQVATRYYPKHPGHQKKWFGFAEFRDQLSISALISVLATLFSLASLFFFPELAILSMACNFISNIFWSIAELHHTYNPQPFDTAETTSKQRGYFYHVLNMTFISLITLSLTLIQYFFPGHYRTALYINIPILSTSILFAINYLFGSNAAMAPNPSHQPPKDAGAENQGESSSSYLTMTNRLNPNRTENLSPSAQIIEAVSQPLIQEEALTIMDNDEQGYNHGPHP